MTGIEMINWLKQAAPSGVKTILDFLKTSPGPGHNPGPGGIPI